jgi:gamma-glutamyltranspeptidase/glutathione hydrolase
MCKLIVLASLLVALAQIAAVAGERPPAARLPPHAYGTGRSVVMAPNGMVATSQPLAAQAGLDVLRQGGSAVDAAIAVNAVLGVVEPMSCGIGGDLFAIVYEAKTGKLHGLNASGRSPYRATRAFFAAQGLHEIPEHGPLSWSVPGCVSGWEELHRKFGKLPVADVLMPGVRYAEQGFPVSEVIAGSWHTSAASLAKIGESSRVYLPGGKAPRVGDVFKNPALARVYREIAVGGAAAFYEGRAAREIVSYSERHGGLFELRDFAEHTSTWVDPVSTKYRGYDVWELPPPGQGIAVLQMLNLLAGYDLAKLGPTSADYWHLFIEAKKLAYADRARYYADPDFAQLPVADLISMRYTGERRKLIDPAKASIGPPAGDLPASHRARAAEAKLGHGDTVYLCVVDKDRNCVSFIQSNYHGFGSHHAPAELGFALQNRGSLFALDENHLNRLEPHRRPFHTIIPALVTKDGRPWLVFGVMGGDMQAQGHVQVLVNLIDFGMNVQEAGEAPRLEHVGSPTPTGQPGDKDGGTTKAENGFPAEVLAELARRGHHISHVLTNGGGYQAIWIDPRTGMLHGGSEYRKDGCAVGY